MTVPYTFGTATTSIPLSNLDANFNTPITLGNTSIYLGNTTTTIGNLTLTNATISSGNIANITITNVSVTTANVTNITVTGTANIATGNVTTLTSTSITDSGLTSGRVTYAGTAGLLQDSANLTFNGTTLTANTIGAYTLGGTIAGGGNQLNNIIIGTTTPLAGSFTTINASTSITNAGLTSGRVTYAGASGLLSDSANLQFNSDGLGIGAAPNTSPGSPYFNLNVGSQGGGGIISAGTDIYFTNNCYIAGNNYFAWPGGSAYASYYNQTGGNHLWKSSTAAGTGGNVATLTDLMKLTQAGNLGIGTSSPTAKLEVVGVEAIRAVNDIAYISFYNSANTTRSGYLQMTSSGASTLSVDVAQPLTFQTTGTERMRIDSTGVVGIGITTAGSNAGVFSQLQIGGTSTANSRTILYGQKNASAGGIISNGYYDASNNLVYSQTYGVSQLYLNNGTFIFSNAASGTAGTNVTVTERMRIDSSGNVGIGTSSPSSLLHLSSSGTTTETITSVGTNVYSSVSFLNTTTGYGYDVGFGGSASVAPNSFYIYGGSTASVKLQVDASGNLGLGVAPSAFASGQVALQNKGGYLGAGSTSELYLSQNVFYGGSPAADRYVNTDYASSFGQTGGAFTFRTAASGTAGNAITFYETLNLGQSVVTISADEANAAAASSIRFRTDGSEKMRLDLDGNLLVGTTNTVIWNTTNTGVAIGGSSAPAIQISRSGDAALLLNRTSSDGDIAIFARQGSAVGGISVNTSSTSFNTSSDYRLKENIVPMTGALAKVLQLKPVTYKWKINGSDGQGFIAHELAEVVPDCVSGEKDAVDAQGNPDYQGVDTSFLVATLVSAIQELKAEVDSLKQQLNGA